MEQLSGYCAGQNKVTCHECKGREGGFVWMGLRAEFLHGPVFQLPGDLPWLPWPCSFCSCWVAVCGLRTEDHHWEIPTRSHGLTIWEHKDFPFQVGWLLKEVFSCLRVPGELGTVSQDDFLSHSWNDKEQCCCHPQLKDWIQAWSGGGKGASHACAYSSTGISRRPPQNVFLEFREFGRQGMIFCVTIFISKRQCSIRGKQIL